MKKHYSFRIVGVLVFCLGISGCKPDTTRQHLEGFSEYLESLGYQFHNPPRSNMGPGTVFRITSDKKFSPVCRNLFAAVSPEPSSVTIPTESSSDVLKIGISLSIISDLLDNGDVGASYDSNTEINFRPIGKTQSIQYYEEDAMNSAGEARELTPQCMGRLRQISETSGLGDGVYFIYDAILLEGVEYSATKTTGSEASANFMRKLIASVKPEVSRETTTETSLQFMEQRYVAFRSMKINQFVDTGLTSSGTAIIQGEPVMLPVLR